jgi:hypothetical protein
MASAAYEVRVTKSEDETFEFSFVFEMVDGSAFPFADYSLQYALAQNGCTVFSLTEASGIAIDTTSGVVTFSAPSPLCAGQYEHGCRALHTASGTLIEIFDGPVTIGKGAYR